MAGKRYPSGLPSAWSGSSRSTVPAVFCVVPDFRPSARSTAVYTCEARQPSGITSVLCGRSFFSFCSSDPNKESGISTAADTTSSAATTRTIFPRRVGRSLRRGRASGDSFTMRAR
ncbi:hypothetical protein SCYAM73S_01216 [Streptomyces cyaneofuscatus]